MGGTQRWDWRIALPVAEELRDALFPACHMIQIAGSLRRCKPDVGDIELVCIPRADTNNIFAVDELDAAIQRMIADGTLAYRLNARGGRTYGPKNKLLVHVPSGIPLDVFSTEARFWGMALLVRTGSAEFNVQVMAHFKRIGFQGHAYGGVTNRAGVELDCPDEETVFRLLGWGYISPDRRIGDKSGENYSIIIPPAAVTP